VFLTTDTNLRYQQNMEGRKLAIVALSRNRWSIVKPMLDKIVEAVMAAKTGTFTIVEIR